MCPCKSRELTDDLSANSDVYLGWTGWAAGGFAGQNYVLSEVPTLSNGVWTDTPIVTQCIVGEFVG
jgi:endoglucanase